MNDKPTILIHLSQGPENPTVAALAFLVARTAVEDGHNVTLFLAGDAVQLMRNDVLNNLAGLGTGKLKEHYDVLAKAGCDFYLSGMSSKSRGLTADDLAEKNVEFASPEVLLRLAMKSDKMFVY
ncbi:MAG TPA: DsrE family protein [Balneolaceae bacterium]